MRKLVLGDIEKCYACRGMYIDGKPCLIFAGEGKGSLHVYHGENFSKAQTIWEGGGGTMSIAEIPGERDKFLVSRGFYSMFEAGESSIELVKYVNGGFVHEPIAWLPWLHRFDMVTGRDGTRYILAATLAESKESKEDWSRPGHLYYAEWTESARLELKELPGSHFHNHGFYKSDGSVYIGADDGVFRVTPPENKGGDWKIEQLLAMPISDVAVIDADGDGKEEMCCILPFHGNKYQVYRGEELIYDCPVPNDFYHVAEAGTIAGEPVFVGGARKETASLFLISMKGEPVYNELDKGNGPSNAHVFNTEKADMLLAANRQIGQAAVYIFPKD